VAVAQLWIVRPIYTDNMSVRYFTRPCWLVLFISALLVPLSHACGELAPSVFKSIGIAYEKGGPQDLLAIAFALLWFAGYIGMTVGVIWCLTDAFISYFRSHHKHG